MFSSLLSRAPKDPHFASVTLLAHLDGSNGATTFTDNSNAAYSMTASGNAAISTAQSRFGGASLGLDGSGDYISGALSANYNFGAGDFTVEGWFRLTALPGEVHLIEQFEGGSGPGWSCYVQSVGNFLEFFYTGAFTLRSTTALTTGAWYYFAVSRIGSSAKLFLDGVLEDTETSGTASDASSLGLRIGARGTVGSWPGHVDEVRITKGVGRYAAGFTRPQRAFPNL